MNLPLHLKVIIFFFCLCYLNTSNAQKPYTTGQFLYSKEINKTEGADVNKFNQLKNLKYPDYISHYAYNDSIVARVVMDSLGNTRIRYVWNYNSRKRVTFTHLGGKIYHTILEITPRYLSKNVVKEISLSSHRNTRDTKLDRRKRKEGEIDEWNIVTIPVYDDFGWRDYSVSSDIELPFMKYVRPKATNVVDSNIIIRIRRFYDFGEIWQDEKLVNFTQEIRNPEWLSESIEGIPHESEYRPKTVVRKRKNLANIPNGSKETEIAIELMNRNRMWTPYYSEFERGGTIGRLRIIFDTEEKSSDKNPAKDKLTELLELGLIAQNEVDYLMKAFKKNKDWDTQTRKKFTNLYFLRKAFLNKSFRKNIIDNFLAKGFKFNFENSEDSLFLKGMIDLGKLLGTEKRVFPTSYPKVIPADQRVVFQEIKQLIEPILQTYNIDFEIRNNVPKSSMTIISKGVNYEIDFVKDIRRGNESGKRSIHVDQYLVEAWLSRLTQLAADQNLELVFGTNEWLNLVLPSSISDEYDQFVSQYPELKLVKDLIYVVAMPKKDYWNDPSIVGVEIHHSEEKDADYQYTFSTILSRGAAGEDYITTNQKNAFIRHLKKYKIEYKLDNFTLSKIISDLKNNVYVVDYQLMEMIPSIHISLPSFSGGFPDIDPKRNDFKDVFPNIVKLTNGDFKAKNLRVDPLSKYILEMDYNGKTLGVEDLKNNHTKSLLKFINTFLLEKGTGIYRYQGLYSWVTDYIYLKDEQAAELEQMFKFRYRKVK